MSESISDEALMAYLDGEAGGDLVSRIEARLQTDAGLRARLDRFAAGDIAVRQAFEALAARATPQRLLDAVHAEAARAQSARAVQVQAAKPARRPLSEILGRPFARPAWVGWAMAAQVLLLVGAAVVLRPPAQPATYHVLSAPQAAARPDALLMFKPDAREADVRLLLQAHQIRIVGGPSTADAYLVDIPAAGQPAAMAALRASPIVALAQPLDASDVR